MGSINRRKFLAGTLSAGTLMSSAKSAEPAPPTPAGNTIDKIDFHVHLGRDQQEQFNAEILQRNVSAAAKYLLKEMDKKRIEKSLLVPVEPLMRTETYLEGSKQDPSRLIPACSVVPRPLRLSLENLKRYRDAGARALKLQPMQYDPADPAVERIIHDAVGMNFPILFHHTDLPASFAPFLERMARTFPEGNFVVIHFGGIYGFADVLPLAHALSNVYLETSTAFVEVVESPLRTHLHFLVKHRLNKLIFGTEHPRDYDRVLNAVDILTGNASAEVKNAVYRGNAAKLLKL